VLEYQTIIDRYCKENEKAVRQHEHAMNQLKDELQFERSKVIDLTQRLQETENRYRAQAKKIEKTSHELIKNERTNLTKRHDEEVASLQQVIKHLQSKTKEDIERSHHEFRCSQHDHSELQCKLEDALVQVQVPH
jgi:alanyl-tRNA synthetase